MREYLYYFTQVYVRVHSHNLSKHCRVCNKRLNSAKCAKRTVYCCLSYKEELKLCVVMSAAKTCQLEHFLHIHKCGSLVCNKLVSDMQIATSERCFKNPEPNFIKSSNTQHCMKPHSIHSNYNSFCAICYNKFTFQTTACSVDTLNQGIELLKELTHELQIHLLM